MADSTPVITADEALDGEISDAASSDPMATLSDHAREVLRVTVPLSVTLAAQRKSVEEIIELGPGSIVKFEKTYDQPLALCVGERAIATGEVVKVGDKFGLRIGRLVGAGEVVSSAGGPFELS